MRADEVPWRIVPTHAEYDSKYGIVKIDIEDIDKLPDAGFNVVCVESGRSYPRLVWQSSRTQKFEAVRLSRYVMNCPDDKVVDVVNHDTLDCRKLNLRVCTRLDDCHNNLGSSRICKYKGVTYRPNRSRPFSAKIGLNGKRITLGYFETELEAAKEYDKQASINYGEFACLNNV